MKIYPYSKASVEEDAIDEDQACQDIITQRELDVSKEAMIGIILNGANAVKTFKRLYRVVEAERSELEAVNPRDYDTQTSFLEALDAVCNHISRATWITKLKEQYGVDNWIDLKALLAVDEEI